jgi:chromosome segregation ATPase
MSDKTFGVKVSEDLHEKVKQMIDLSGGSAKEWFEKAVALSEIQDLKEGAKDYQSDLSELEVHTTRIYQLVANMVQRANYLKDDAVKNLTDKLDSRDETISTLQMDLKKLKEDIAILSEEKVFNKQEKEGLEKQVEELRVTNENTQSLIQEYKDKIDTLSTLVNQYKGYEEENKHLKEQHSTEKAQLLSSHEQKEARYKSSIEELQATVRDQQQALDDLEVRLTKKAEESRKENESLKVNYENQLTQVNDKKDLEKERAILEIERKYQGKLEKAHEQYNAKIASLYEKLERSGKEEKDDKK